MNTPSVDQFESALNDFEEEDQSYDHEELIENFDWASLWTSAVPLNEQYGTSLGWIIFSKEINVLLLKAIGQSNKVLSGEYFAYAVGIWQHNNKFGSAINGVLDAYTWGLFKKELAKYIQSQVVILWGTKADIASVMTKLITLILPYSYNKKYEQLTAAQQTEFSANWAQIRTDILDARKNLIGSGFVPVLGGSKVPFGFYLSSSGRGLGTFNSTTQYLRSEQTDRVLLRLFQQGKINITQDELDLFQRIAKSETYGMIQLLNSYDSAYISIGFMQLTLKHGKVQEWINLVPAAFRKYGIELHLTEKYDFGDKNIQQAIAGVPDANKINLRFNGWAERFYYAGLDEDIIIAEVELAKKWVIEHRKDLKYRLHTVLKSDDYYNLFINNYYNHDQYIRGLFHVTLNNNPYYSTICVQEAIRTSGTTSVPAFLEAYKAIIRRTNDWYNTVDNASHGTSLVLPTATAQPEYSFDNETARYDYEYDEELFYESSEDEQDDEYTNEDYHSNEEDYEETAFVNNEDYYATDEAYSTDEMNEAEIVDETAEEENYQDHSYTNETNISANEVSPIPASGLTAYLVTSGVKGRALKTGVFIPPGFVFSPDVDIIVYLHGLWESGYSKNGMETYWNKYTNLRAHFVLSGRNAILLAPLLGTDPQKSSHVFIDKSGFDNFVASCFAELKAMNCIPVDANPNRIILAAHSAGGKPMSIILNSKSNQLVKKIDECWGFDCLYGYSFGEWLNKDSVNNKLYHYWAYTKSGSMSTPGKNGDKLQRDHTVNMFNIAPKEKVQHQGIIEYAWRNEVNKRPWFQPISSLTAHEMQEATKMKKSMKVFWYPKQVLSNVTAPTLPATAPVATAVAAVPCSSAAMLSTFFKISFAVSQKVATGASESSYSFTRRTIQAIGKDPDTWYKSFVKTSFLGVTINGPVYIELANLLRNIETAFINTYDPVNRHICTVRQKLGITTETFSGGRSESTAALKSMHLFGLALDVNIAGNAFVQNKEIVHNSGRLNEYTQPSGVNTINDLLSAADKLFGGQSLKFSYHLSYDDYVKINAVLTRYLKLLDDDTLLQQTLSITTSTEWQARNLVAAKAKIQNDLDTLATALVRWTKRTELKNNGFLNLSKAFVDGMIAGGLDWGGSGYGDMMHFDMRTTGIGKRIHDAIG
ncbi:hypothetical protein BH11BAC4_BH11BAC4_07660 [soil metagenome]